MVEGSATEIIRKVVFRAEPYIPQVPKPKKKLTLQRRLLWSGVALLIYMVMGQTPLFGAVTPETDFLAFAGVAGRAGHRADSHGWPADAVAARLRDTQV